MDGRQMDGMDGWIDEWIARRNEWMDRWMDVSGEWAIIDIDRRHQRHIESISIAAVAWYVCVAKMIRNVLGDTLSDMSTDRHTIESGSE